MGKRYYQVIAAALLVTAAVPAAAEMNKKRVAAQAVQELNLEMRKKLMESLQKGGPAGAIDVCAKEAPAIAARIGEELGVIIKRTSLKLRNPRNVPDPAEKALLEKLAASYSAGQKLPEGVNPFPGDPSRFYKVITVDQVCLKCHGNPASMSEAVSKELAATYPNDKAVGYKAGDFRGIISVMVKGL